jgi:hypothetical protein
MPVEPINEQSGSERVPDAMQVDPINKQPVAETAEEAAPVEPIDEHPRQWNPLMSNLEPRQWNPSKSNLERRLCWGEALKPQPAKRRIRSL